MKTLLLVAALFSTSLFSQQYTKYPAGISMDDAQEIFYDKLDVGGGFEIVSASEDRIKFTTKTKNIFSRTVMDFTEKGFYFTMDSVLITDPKTRKKSTADRKLIKLWEDEILEMFVKELDSYLPIKIKS